MNFPTYWGKRMTKIKRFLALGIGLLSLLVVGFVVRFLPEKKELPISEDWIPRKVYVQEMRQVLDSIPDLSTHTTHTQYRNGLQNQWIADSWAEPIWQLYKNGHPCSEDLKWQGWAFFVIDFDNHSETPLSFYDGNDEVIIELGKTRVKANRKQVKDLFSKILETEIKTT